jgi:hypothetical protein
MTYLFGFLAVIAAILSGIEHLPFLAVFMIIAAALFFSVEPKKSNNSKQW